MFWNSDSRSLDLTVNCGLNALNDAAIPKYIDVTTHESSRKTLAGLFFGISLALSNPYKKKAGKATVHARKARDVAV